MKVKLFETTMTTVTIRLFLMMLVAGIALTTGIIPLIYLALPIFLTAILGIKFDKDIKHKTNKIVIPIHKKRGIQKVA